ncbi:uncharacterized protein [Physcomitrium patens]|uniref:uncharacterized protein isoform X4 n=1 Tax=Physcomitrium patens TaxID=3218 RepID=UPI003CCDA7A5
MDRRKLQIKHICRSEGTFTAIDTRSCLRIYFPPQKLNPAFDQWELNMTHAYHEGLEATGFEPPGAPPVLVKPQEKPRDNRHCL